MKLSIHVTADKAARPAFHLDAMLLRTRVLDRHAAEPFADAHALSRWLLRNPRIDVRTADDGRTMVVSYGTRRLSAEDEEYHAGAMLTINIA